MNTKPAYRVGLIVPSSNTTMETEIPAMLRARGSISAERFSYPLPRLRPSGPGCVKRASAGFHHHAALGHGPYQGR